MKEYFKYIGQNFEQIVQIMQNHDRCIKPQGKLNEHRRVLE